MSKCFNVPNYFAYLKISCYTSLKFLSLGVNTSGFICSFIQNKKASPNSWWAAWDSRNGEWEQLQIWLGKPCHLGPPFCGIMCLLFVDTASLADCQLLGGPWYTGESWKPFFFSRTLFCQWVFPTSSLFFALSVVLFSQFTEWSEFFILQIMIPSTWEAAGRGSLWVPGQLCLHNETLSKQRAKTIMLSLTFESAVSSSSWLVPPCPIT